MRKYQPTPIKYLNRLARWIAFWALLAPATMLTIYMIFADIWDSTETYDYKAPYRWLESIIQP